MTEVYLPLPIPPNATFEVVRCDCGTQLFASTATLPDVLAHRNSSGRAVHHLTTRYEKWLTN